MATNKWTGCGEESAGFDGSLLLIQRQFIVNLMADVFLLAMSRERMNECLTGFASFIRDGMFEAELDGCRFGTKSLKKSGEEHPKKNTW